MRFRVWGFGFRGTLGRVMEIRSCLEFADELLPRRIRGRGFRVEGLGEHVKGPRNYPLVFHRGLFSLGLRQHP